ncbi:hypothetical protein TWF225_001829 [Orbilia oligospora]|nr:hypothetical protein TWF225_001829 [Orbilia oligospora]
MSGGSPFFNRDKATEAERILQIVRILNKNASKDNLLLCPPRLGIDVSLLGKALIEGLINILPEKTYIVFFKKVGFAGGRVSYVEIITNCGILL